MEGLTGAGFKPEIRDLSSFEDDYGLKPINGEDDDNGDDEEGDEEEGSDEIGGSEGYEIVEGHEEDFDAE